MCAPCPVWAAPRTNPVRSCPGLATAQLTRTGKEKGQSHLQQMTQPQGEIELWLKAFSVIIPAPPPRNWENQVSPLPCSPHVAEYGNPVARISCFSLIPAQLHWLAHCERKEIPRVSPWRSSPLSCSSLHHHSCPSSLGEVGNQRLPCWVGTLHVLMQLCYGWSSSAHTAGMIQSQ